uniref:Uncharacterized protein n=1 Tax=Avena sativa TaxID=4498 RepID=A0ACD5XPI4_AVESA
MVELSSRCLAFAEVVVTMVCPMLLTLSLKKDKEPVLPMPILAVAGATVVTGICPLLACCISKTERYRTVGARWPSVTRGLASTISSTCLLVLSCWLALRLVSENFVMFAGFLSGVCLLLRAVTYWTRSAEDRRGLPEKKGDAPVAADEEKEKELRSMVDKSHEFLSGVTGILFLGLGGLALEGLLSTRNGAGDALRPHMTVSLFICAFGVTLMSVQMIPPRGAAEKAGVVYFSDFTVAVGTAALLVTIMVKLMGIVGLLFLIFPVIIFVHLLYTVKVNAWRPPPAAKEQPALAARENGGTKHPTASPPSPTPDSNGDKDNLGEESKPAPMGLTKVTLTGFLAVSVKAISGGSPSEWTVCCFLLFAAAAIASGVSWRLLTHTHKMSRVGRRSAVDEAANVASFCTHFCVAVATVLFAVMAWKAGSAKECAHVSQVTCVQLNSTLDVQRVKDMCSCIF